ncbi:RHS repeat-associated core domain-containing protein [Undibacterium sp. RTI2.1]|uniref:RHS repeat-associated core domain-containing protein n=1 Tax=Undibacterium sp. RTI2.1 TaxID=3048637 RepID=UPI002B22EC74|nr:RHS repeat-associated core domain-containing protein [Undibacterium sp. RTI2.1]MEB0032208.1 RHS repeat-associated core domain-containing protein [Undibacterium sp. RTI2.1]
MIDWTTNTNNGTDRGYTGHEHLDDMGVIQMNGRIYDPLLGRFMQGDPFIQDPSNLQNFNRYGYCYNNPMTCTDPTGQLFGIDDMFFVALIAIWGAEKAGIIDARTARQITAIAFTIASGVPQTFAEAAQTGFFSGAISSGNLKGALQGGFTAGMFYGAGNVIGGGNFFTGGSGTQWTVAEGVALHSVVGCVTSVASGGKCGPRALSAAFTKAIASTDFMKSVTDSGDRVTGTLVSAIVRGTASVFGGGKFANGAQTAIFSYLMNEVAHWKQMERASARALRYLGFKVEQGVKLLVTSADGTSRIMIADSVAMKDGLLIITEVKDGLGAKLSAAQKMIFEIAKDEGTIAIVSSDRAGRLGLEARVNLIEQTTFIQRIAISLEANIANKAAGQLTRVLGTDGAATIFRVAKIATGLMATITIELATHSDDVH